jgi:hypothetical protein
VLSREFCWLAPKSIGTHKAALLFPVISRDPFVLVTGDTGVDSEGSLPILPEFRP